MSGDSNIQATRHATGQSGRWITTTCSVILIGALALGGLLFSDHGNSSHNTQHTVQLLANAKLTDQHGNKIRKRELKDKLVLLNFFFTSCGSACPLQTRVIRDIQENLANKSDVLFLSVSIAPLTDTQKTIADYIEKFDASQPNWQFATTSVENTKALISQFGVTLENAIVTEDQIDHRNMGYLFSKGGLLMQQYQLVPGSDKRIIREMTELRELADT